MMGGAKARVQPFDKNFNFGLKRGAAMASCQQILDQVLNQTQKDHTTHKHNNMLPQKPFAPKQA